MSFTPACLLIQPCNLRPESTMRTLADLLLLPLHEAKALVPGLTLGELEQLVRDERILRRDNMGKAIPFLKQAKLGEARILASTVNDYLATGDWRWPAALS